MQAIYLEEFTPTREQFELTLEAEWYHARFADAAEQRWRFFPSKTDAEFFRNPLLGEPPSEPAKAVGMRREFITIPELRGNEPISALHVRYDGKSWVYALGIFFHVRLEELPDETSH